MAEKKTKRTKGGLHPNNLHKRGYDFKALGVADPEFARYVKPSAHGKLSIDFSDDSAVLSLNRALLKHHYGVDGWEIPEGFLCPPIPGRVDYIHYIADQLVDGEKKPNKVKMLDVGTGANGIYSILASQVYGWRCVGSDIDPLAIENVSLI